MAIVERGNTGMSRKVLNLYAGIGGNRLKWEDCDVTAVEISPDVAEVYAHYNPDDEIVIGDAHDYLLQNYDKGFDFIWASPPCPSHSRMMKATRHDLRKYPDMALYQEVIWLQNFFDGDWVVENVVPYYDPLIPPQSIGRHCFWSNEIIRANEVPSPDRFIVPSNQEGLNSIQDWLGIHWDKPIYLGDHDPAKAYRNAVHPDLGLAVFNSVISGTQQSFFM